MAVSVVASMDATKTDADLVKLETRLSPAGLQKFLATSAHQYLSERAEDRFQNEGDGAVGPWPQLRATTARIRGSQGYGPFHPINVRTGELKDFVLETFYTASGPGGERLVMPGRIPADSDLMEKFRTAQRGGNVSRSATSRFIGPSVPAPPRPVVGLSPMDLSAIQTLLRIHVLGTYGPIGRP